MPNEERHHFISGIWATGLGTLTSRVLGLARDMATAALLGLGESAVMDAFVVAFRIPNLFRRLFGEGALAASYLPVFTAERQNEEARAWKLASVVLVWLTLVLTGLVVVAEVLLGLAWITVRENPPANLLIGLTASLLPYVVTICIASLLAATLQALSKFSVSAAAPALLNICWLAGAWLIAPRVASDKLAQAYVLVVCIQVAGVLQVAVQWPALRAAGFRFDYDWKTSGQAAMKIGKSIAAVSFGLVITQINTLLDSLLAWALAAEPGGSTTVAWLGGVDRPLRAGAAAAIHYGERFYQLPLGILGFAIATAIFPLLSRRAAQGDRQQLSADLTFGLRVALFTSLPAGVGLVLLSEPLARLVYQHGAFTADDAARTARMIACYSTGVWAYCAAPVVVRGFYALGDQLTPVRIGIAAMTLNLALDCSLVWPLAEVGLALSTSLAAMVQFGLLLAIFGSRYDIAWKELGGSVLKTVLATTAMALVVIALQKWLAVSPSRGWEIARVAAAIAAGIGTFLLVAKVFRATELELLLHRRPDSDRSALNR